MTNRIDHTNCSHQRTPAARKLCREARSLALRNAQQAIIIEAPNAEDLVIEYALLTNIEVHEAWTIVETGEL